MLIVCCIKRLFPYPRLDFAYSHKTMIHNIPYLRKFIMHAEQFLEWKRVFSNVSLNGKTERRAKHPPVITNCTHNTDGSEPVERPTQKRHTCIHCAKYARGRWIRNKIIFATLDVVECAPETCVSSVPFFHARSLSFSPSSFGLCRIVYPGRIYPISILMRVINSLCLCLMNIHFKPSAIATHAHTQSHMWWYIRPGSKQYASIHIHSVAKKVRVIKKSSEKNSEAEADDCDLRECVYDGVVRGRATAPSRIYVIQLQNSKRQSNNKNAIAEKKMNSKRLKRVNWTSATTAHPQPTHTHTRYTYINKIGHIAHTHTHSHPLPFIAEWQ